MVTASSVAWSTTTRRLTTQIRRRGIFTASSARELHANANSQTCRMDVLPAPVGSATESGQSSLISLSNSAVCQKYGRFPCAKSGKYFRKNCMVSDIHDSPPTIRLIGSHVKPFTKRLRVQHLPLRIHADLP